MSDSPQLVDFAIRLVNFLLNFPDGQVKFLRISNIITEELCNQSCSSKRF